MPIFIRRNVSHPPKIFLSETSCVELPKNLFICLKGTLESLLLDITKTPQSYLLLLNFKQRVSPQIVKMQITENHLKPPKTVFKHPKPSTILQNHSPRNICNHPKPTITTQNHPQSARIYLELAVTSLKPSISIPAVIHKIFETRSSFHVKQRTTAKIQFFFSRNFCQY